MFKLLRKLFGKEKDTKSANTEIGTTTPNDNSSSNNSSCRKLEFYDRFIIVNYPHLIEDGASCFTA